MILRPRQIKLDCQVDRTIKGKMLMKRFRRPSNKAFPILRGPRIEDPRPAAIAKR
jgi:hypothetical protein